jgi:septal ring factor EnvC (AmiA/AmiB activator)
VPDGHIDRAVECLLGAVGDLDEIGIRQADNQIDAAIAKVLAASSTRLSNYAAMLQKLKDDIGTVHTGIRATAHEIEELAVRIDNADY